MANIVKAAQSLTGGQAAGDPVAVALPEMKPEFLHPDARTTVVDLAWPLSYGGKVYNQIVVRRPTMQEWNDYNKKVADAIVSGGEEAGDRVDQPFYDAPAAVINSLDFVDGAKLSSIVDAFFGSSPSTSSPTSQETAEAPQTDPVEQSDSSDQES